MADLRVRIGRALLAFLLAGQASASIATCALSNATYAGKNGAIVMFRNVGKRAGWPSDLALAVRSAAGRSLHWFLFDRGSARYLNLISTTDVLKPGWSPPPPDGGDRPLGEMHFIAATRSLAIGDEIPTSRDQAPAYLLLPDLPEVMMHRAQPPENVGLFFFRLSKCGRR